MFLVGWVQRALAGGWRFTGAALLLCLAAPCWADVWAYVDEKGVPHFASERLDDRYELFFRNTESFDTSQDMPAPEAPVAATEPPPAFVAPTRLLAFFENSPSFKLLSPHLREASNAHNIDFELLQALIATESGFDVGAVSPKGAIGLMQIMPDTARRYGVDGDQKLTLEKKLTDPKINIKTGSRYLRDLINMFPGQLELAIAAYNAGEGAVQRAGNRIPNYKETQAYVKTVMSIYTTLKPPAPVAAERRRVAARVRMQLPGSILGEAPVGGAVGRGNMVSPLTAASVQPEFKIERE